jgi:hypothetical protein
LIDASSRIAVCGQPPVSTPMMRERGLARADGSADSDPEAHDLKSLEY